MNLENLPKPIFDLSRKDWKFKGIVEGELDNEAAFEGQELPPPDWIVEFWGIIYVDENGIWNLKARIKFPSGNKQVISKPYGANCNETIILQDVYQLPFKCKNWHRNPCGTAEGMLDLMEKNDLILSKTIVEVDKETK